MQANEATTMTVQAMGALLGLKKTESYYLVNKKQFETVVIAGQQRVVRDSFEAWYARQDRYKKQDGDPPGAMLHSNMYSVQDMANMLDLDKSTVLDLIHKENLLTLTLEGKYWVPKVVFDEWYSTQSWYRKQEERERDREAEEKSITVPAMGRLIGLDRRAAWKLYYREKTSLKLIRVGDKPRITLDSFERWLASQSEYAIIEEQPTEAEEAAVPEVHPDYVPALDIAAELKIDPRKLYRALQNNSLKGRRVGRTWYVQYEDYLALTARK